MAPTAICRTVVIVSAEMAYYNFGQLTIVLWKATIYITACCMTTVLQIAVAIVVIQ
jgi:hypothetical protein